MSASDSWTDARAAHQLPMLEAARMRADGARNRERILSAARELFEERAVERVRVEDVARQAGLGKATVFRHFGDRSGLVAALLDDSDRELQERILRGAPPLGPGAPPCVRLHAFLDALIELLERFGDLMFDSENARPGARYRIRSYHAWHQHVAILLAEANPRGGDASTLAHALLASLAADLFHYLRGQDRVSVPTYRAAIHALAAGICPEGNAARGAE